MNPFLQVIDIERLETNKKRIYTLNFYILQAHLWHSCLCDYRV